jgi:hypothetical protein
MVESRRKHGAFDSRYPTLSTPPAPAWVLDANQGLEWAEFRTRFFPGRRRHDIEALAAYGAYRSGSSQPYLDRRQDGSLPPGPQGNDVRKTARAQACSVR